CRNGSWRSWTMSRRTLSAGSRNACVRHDGRIPVSAASSSQNSSSVNVARPQPLCWTSSTSRVPSLRWLIVSERITSSVTTPPALRSTWVSPMSIPNRANTSIRESMHVTTAVRNDGGTASPSALAAARRPPPASYRWRSSSALTAPINHAGPVPGGRAPASGGSSHAPVGRASGAGQLHDRPGQGRQRDVRRAVLDADAVERAQGDAVGVLLVVGRVPVLALGRGEHRRVPQPQDAESAQADLDRGRLGEVAVGEEQR